MIPHKNRTIPPWLDEILATSEAMAMLSLAGNHVSNLTPAAVGTTIHYATRGLDGEQTGNEFTYDVLATFGQGRNGRAMAFRPHHSPSDIIIAFRGVRVEQLSPELRPQSPRRSSTSRDYLGTTTPQPESAAASADADDLAALLDLIDCTTKWPENDVGYQLHHGILTHHEAIWHGSKDGRRLSRPEPSPIFDKIGVESPNSVFAPDIDFAMGQYLHESKHCDTTPHLAQQVNEHATGWPCPGLAPRSIRESLDELTSSPSTPTPKREDTRSSTPSNCRQSVEGLFTTSGPATLRSSGDAVADLGDWLAQLPSRPNRLLLVGLSLGGALAQMTALRIISEPGLEDLVARLFVLAMGSPRWADDRAAHRFRLAMADRAVMLINSMVVPPPLPRNAFWWMSEELLPPDARSGGIKVENNENKSGEQLDAVASPHAVTTEEHSPPTHASSPTQSSSLAAPLHHVEHLAAAQSVAAAEFPAQVEASSVDSFTPAGHDGHASPPLDGYVVVDPLTVGYSPKHELLHNVFLCHQLHVMPSSVGPSTHDESREASQVRHTLDEPFCSTLGDAYSPPGLMGGSVQEEEDAHARERSLQTLMVPMEGPALEMVARMRSQPCALAALMHGRLPVHHPMAMSYQALHLGRRYRAAFLSLYLARRHILQFQPEPVAAACKPANLLRALSLPPPTAGILSQLQLPQASATDVPVLVKPLQRASSLPPNLLESFRQLQKTDPLPGIEDTIFETVSLQLVGRCNGMSPTPRPRLGRLVDSVTNEQCSRAASSHGSMCDSPGLCEMTNFGSVNDFAMV